MGEGLKAMFIEGSGLMLWGVGGVILGIMLARLEGYLRRRSQAKRGAETK